MRSLLSLCLLWGLVSLSAAAFAAQAEVPSEKIEILRSRATQGNLAAEVELGLTLLASNQSSQDCSEAIAWLQKAAAQKSGHAYYILGTAYQNGVCVAKDLTKALAFYNKGSEVGSGLCDVRMGDIYQEKKEPPEKILGAYEKAVAKESIEGRYSLGRYLFENGKDEKTLRRAFDLIKQAAQDGGFEATYLLALMYGKGIGAEQNFEASHLWMGVAAELGNKKAIEAFKVISTTEMTPEQIKQSQTLAFQIKQKLLGK